MMQEEAARRAAHLLSRTARTESGCMEFVGCVQSNGYARATVNRKTDGAHRHIYRLIHGDIPDGFDVCHKCDNRRCINPDHLFLGTRRENMMDAASKGRVAKGLKLPHTKLSFADRAKICELAEIGVPYRDIASQFGVCKQYAGRVAIERGIRRNNMTSKGVTNAE